MCEDILTSIKMEGDKSTVTAEELEQLGNAS
jgi:hypothetical protein